MPGKSPQPGAVESMQVMEPVGSSPTASLEERVFAIERPDPSLWRYYVLRSFLLGPFFFVLLVYSWFRYRTLRYRFDDEGVSMAWGILFRREINLTYARIQDIHLSSNVVERWLGLARIEIQTASGSAKAEMTIEGIPQYGELRDFLYSKMRGVSGDRDRTARPGTSPAARPPTPSPPSGEDELAAVLREVAAELRAIRRQLGEGGTGDGG